MDADITFFDDDPTDDPPDDAPGEDCPDHGPYGGEDCPKC
jgi:hypothetical protein